MSHVQTALVGLIDRACPTEGIHGSHLPGARWVRVSRPARREKGYWGSSLCIVAQGTKEIVLGRRAYRFDDLHYIATPIDLPVLGAVASASPARPFVCLRIALNPMLLREVDAQLEMSAPAESERSLRGIFVGEVSDRMLEVVLRLGKLMQVPEDAPVLGALAVKEILYHLLKGPDGPGIRQLVRSGSTTQRVAQAIYTLTSELGDEVSIESLAKAANMSRSSFFRHFKEVTSISPIQYRKRLRLLAARRLMIDEGENAESSAFRVGYKSASQFSREYSRMFGLSPAEDPMRTRRQRGSGRSTEAFVS